SRQIRLRLLDFSHRRHPTARRGAPRAGPSVERLEDRTILAVNLWTGLAGSINADINWSNPANWSLNAIPGPADTVQFTRNAQVKAFLSTVDQPFTVAGVQIDGSWGGAIAVNQALTMSQGLDLASGTFGGNGAMTIAGTSNWTGGSLRLGTGG